MKKIINVFLLLIFIFSPLVTMAKTKDASTASLPGTSAYPASWKGVNAYKSLTREDFIYFRNNKISTVRIMFMDGDLLTANRDYDPADPADAKIRPENLARLRELIALGREYGIKLVIDVHEVPGLKRWFLAADEQEDWRIWANTVEGARYRNLLVSLWKQLAAELKSAPSDAVVFELLNEPVPRIDPKDWANESYGYIWTNLQDRIIKEIRKQDQKHMILAAPPYSWRPNSLDSWKPSYTVLRDAKLAVSVHAFFPISYTYQWDAWSGKSEYLAYPGVFSEQYYGQSYWDRSKIEEALSPVELFYAKYGKKVYISEFGVTRGAPGAELWLSDMVSSMNSMPGTLGWAAHVWGESAYMESKGIWFDPVLGGMYDFASAPEQLEAVLGGL